jgi:hypothetical protein
VPPLSRLGFFWRRIRRLKPPVNKVSSLSGLLLIDIDSFLFVITFAANILFLKIGGQSKRDSYPARCEIQFKKLYHYLTSPATQGQSNRQFHSNCQFQETAGKSCPPLNFSEKRINLY